MSSVSSSGGSSGADETTRKMRDEYRKKEAELIKKHQKELAAVDRKYSAEVSKLKEANTESVKDVRAKASDSLTNRDQKYQKEIEEMRAMHNKQIERLMADNAQKNEVARDTAKSEVKQANLGKNDRTEALNKKFNDAVALNEANYTKQIEALREQQGESIERTRKQLADTHKKEIEALRDSRDEQVSALKNEVQSTRTNANQRLKNQDVQHMGDKARIQSNNMNTHIENEKKHNEMMDEAREGYTGALKGEQKKFSEQMAKNSELREKFENDFSATVQDRMQTRENRLEQEVREARNESIASQTKSQKQAKTEVKNIRDAYQTKFDYLEKARQDTLEQANANNADNVKKVHAQADKIIATTNRQTAEKADTEVFRYRQALDQTKEEAKAREEYKDNTADARVMSVRERSIKDTERLRDNFVSNLDVLKEGNAAETKELRMNAEVDKQKAVAALKEQITKKEGEHQLQMAAVTSKYEKRIAELNDQFTREKRLRDNREKQLVTDLKRNSEAQIESVKLKYEEANKAQVANQQKELQDTNRRHKDQIDNIMSISKKA